MAAAGTLVHLLGALRRAAGRVFLTFLLTLIIVGAATEGIFYLIAGKIDMISHVLAALMGVGWAIAVSMLVLVAEVVRGLVTGVRDTVKDVEKDVSEAGSLVGGVMRSVEGKGQPKS